MTEHEAWLDQARDDMQAARLCREGGIYNIACFLCQQAAEKGLKAFLVGRRAPLPKVHSLPDLLILCKQQDEEFAKIKEECVALDIYYSPTRYPDAARKYLPEKLTKGEAEEASGMAEKIINLVKLKVDAK